LRGHRRSLSGGRLKSNRFNISLFENLVFLTASPTSPAGLLRAARRRPAVLAAAQGLKDEKLWNS
jgi:hypothetical protein